MENKIKSKSRRTFTSSFFNKAKYLEIKLNVALKWKEHIKKEKRLTPEKEETYYS